MDVRYLRCITHGSTVLFLLLFVVVQIGQSGPFTPGTPEVLVDSEAGFFMNPVWSPDGGQIAFTSAEYRGIWTVSTDGKEFRQLTNEDAAGYGFSWSMEGGTIADLQTVVIRDFGDSRVLNTTVSPDGLKMAFQLMSEGLFVMESDGSNLRELGHAEHPAWGPDGTFLVAMVTEDDGHRITGSEIYAIDTESGERHHLTSHTDLIALSPTVSPDGRYVTFSDYESGHIYTMPIR